MKSKLKEAEYEFTSGELEISMSINFERGQYTLYTDTHSLDFCFFDSDPAKSRAVIELIAGATEYAIQAIANHKKDICTEGKTTATVKTEIKITAVHPKPVAVLTGPNDTDGKNNNDSDTSHGNANGKGV